MSFESGKKVQNQSFQTEIDIHVSMGVSRSEAVYDTRIKKQGLNRNNRSFE